MRRWPQLDFSADFSILVSYLFWPIGLEYLLISPDSSFLLSTFWCGSFDTDDFGVILTVPVFDCLPAGTPAALALPLRLPLVVCMNSFREATLSGC